MARAIASIRRERALFMMRRPRSVAEINVDLALSGWGFRWATLSLHSPSTIRVMVGPATPSIRTNRPSIIGPPKTRTDRALSRAGVSPDSASAPVTDVKVMATGLGIGILIDATIVRALLVPALVVLFGRYNWWLPSPLARVLGVAPSSVGTSTATPLLID
jgi:hypothetical protein